MRQRLTARWELAHGPGTLRELERTFGRDPYDQIGGYVKRGLGLNAYIRIENPSGQRVQQVFVGGERVKPGRHHPAVFVTEQGVAQKYGRNRQKHTGRSIGALREYLARHRPLHAELRETFVAVLSGRTGPGRLGVDRAR